MTTYEETTEEVTTESAEEPTRLILNAIDFAAAGSWELDRLRGRLQREYWDAVEAHDSLVDDIRALRLAREAQPEDDSLISQLKHVLKQYRKAKRVMDAAIDAIHDHYISRMSTSDGTPVAMVLRKISKDLFEELIQQDGNSVAIPKASTPS